MHAYKNRDDDEIGDSNSDDFHQTGQGEKSRQCPIRTGVVRRGRPFLMRFWVGHYNRCRWQMMRPSVVESWLRFFCTSLSMSTKTRAAESL